MLKFNINQGKLYQPSPSSHKGQNGKLLVIGGSRLFHSSIFWSADIASRIVDVVHFSSPANENNEIVRKRIKEGFWSGIVVDWGDVEKYIEEDDCVLIGPGMIRSEDDAPARVSRVGQPALSSLASGVSAGLSEAPTPKPDRVITVMGNGASIPSKQSSRIVLESLGKEDKTKQIIDYLLKKYPTKRWVIDGGALQEIDPKLITESCILTPHRGEFLKLADKSYKNYKDHNCANLSDQLCKCTILLKGQVDTVCQGKRCVLVEGGNPGMTKGGTGDVLAGLVAALYCLAERDPALQDKNAQERRREGAWRAATIGSWVAKHAGDSLYKRVGPYFNAADLLGEVPKTLGKLASGKYVA